MTSLTYACLVLFVTAVFSLPIDSDTKKSDSSDQSQVTVIENTKKIQERTGLVDVLDSGLNVEELSADLSSDKHRRSKRQVFKVGKGHGCPQGKIKFMKKCIKFEKYERMLKDIKKK